MPLSTSSHTPWHAPLSLKRPPCYDLLKHPCLPPIFQISHTSLLLPEPLRERAVIVLVQGRCPTLPSQTASVATPVGTCQLVIEEDLLEISPSNTDFWLSNIHIRLVPTRRTYTGAALILHFGETLWLTNVMLEGNGFRCRGVDVAPTSSRRRSLYASGATPINSRKFGRGLWSTALA
jgi:hypothetical protein